MPQVARETAETLLREVSLEEIVHPDQHLPTTPTIPTEAQERGMVVAAVAEDIEEQQPVPMAADSGQKRVPPKRMTSLPRPPLGVQICLVVTPLVPPDAAVDEAVVHHVALAVAEWPELAVDYLEDLREAVAAATVEAVKEASVSEAEWQWAAAVALEPS